MLQDVQSEVPVEHLPGDVYLKQTGNHLEDLSSPGGDLLKGSRGGAVESLTERQKISKRQGSYLESWHTYFPGPGRS